MSSDVSAKVENIVAEPGSIVNPCLAAMPNLDSERLRRLHLLEQYDLGFLLLGLSPRRLLRDGRIFDNEQVLPLLLWYAQWDKHCRHFVASIFTQWSVFNPSQGDFEGTSDDVAIKFRDYFQEKYARPLIEEFRQFVALTILYPEEHNAPSGPIDMVWHSFILMTDEYMAFSRDVWTGAQHVPPAVPDEPGSQNLAFTRFSVNG